MEFYFGCSGRTIKVEINELDINLLCMATALGMELGFCEINICLLI